MKPIYSYSSVPEQKIGRYSVLEMHSDYILLKLKKPAGPYLAALAISPLFCFFLYYWSDSSDPQMVEDLIICLTAFLLLQTAVTIYHILLEDHYEMHINNHKISMQRYFKNKKIKERELRWKAGSTFSYELIYASYNDLSEVWLTAYHPESKEKVRLMNFYDVPALEAFRIIFEKKYPFKIGAWHN
jgi:hypothetical protein